MKKNVTYVDASKFEAIIGEVGGLDVLVQKGFVKISAQKGRNVYVAATREVARVDISGFDFALGTVPLSKPNGAVTCQLDFSQKEEDILEAFRACLEHMKTLGPREQIRSARSAASNATGWSFQKRPEAASSDASQEASSDV